MNPSLSPQSKTIQAQSLERCIIYFLYLLIFYSLVVMLLFTTFIISNPFWCYRSHKLKANHAIFVDVRPIFFLNVKCLYIYCVAHFLIVEWVNF